MRRWNRHKDQCGGAWIGGRVEGREDRWGVRPGAEWAATSRHEAPMGGEARLGVLTEGWARVGMA